MSRKETYRGPVLKMGLKGGEEESIDHAFRRRRRRLLAGVVLLALSFGPLLMTGSPYFAPENSSIPRFAWALVAALLPVLVFSIVNLQAGLEIDCVYENGITNRRSTLLARILRRSFAPFQEIKVIGHGRELFEGKDVAFVGLKAEDGSLLLPPFVDSGYTNDFFDVLATQLKKRCPDAEWLEVSWQDLW